MMASRSDLCLFSFIKGEVPGRMHPPTQTKFEVPTQAPFINI